MKVELKCYNCKFMSSEGGNQFDNPDSEYKCTHKHFTGVIPDMHPEAKNSDLEFYRNCKDFERKIK